MCGLLLSHMPITLCPAALPLLAAVKVAGKAMEVNMTRLGPLVLPWSGAQRGMGPGAHVCLHCQCCTKLRAGLSLLQQLRHVVCDTKWLVLMPAPVRWCPPTAAFCLQRSLRLPPTGWRAMSCGESACRAPRCQLAS